MTKGEHWQNDPEDHNYDAAENYLSLIASPHIAESIAESLKGCSTVVCYKAKDILRASGLPLLSQDDKYLEEHFKKINDKKKLSPILLVRGNWEDSSPLIVADGYHRICASYWIDPDIEIPCRIV